MKMFTILLLKAVSIEVPQPGSVPFKPSRTLRNPYIAASWPAKTETSAAKNPGKGA